MTDSGKPSIDLDALSSLARRFAERRMFDEAGELLQMALRLDPKNRGLQLNLAQVRQKQRAMNGHRSRNTHEQIHEEIRRNAIDAAHFFGLAALYEERGKRDQAAECLEIARSKGIANPFIPKLNGKLLLRRHQYDAAAEELRLARRFNPFDREIAELLSLAEYERENYREALETAIDAFLLLEDNDHDHGVVLKQRIRKLKSVQKLSSQDLVQLFHQRRDKLQTDFDRLEWKRERFLAPIPATPTASPTLTPVQTKVSRLELAARLRHLPAWDLLTDEAVFQLAAAVRQEVHAQGAKIFTFGSENTDIYVLEEGEIAIRRPTPYGTFELGALHPGKVFGELSFITLSERSGEAIATEAATVLRVSARDLELMVGDDPNFGLQVYRSFWRNLASTLRQANEQLRTFFSDPNKPPDWLEKRRSQRPDAGAVDIDHDDKIQLFREQGLTGSELGTLAKFSAARRYPGGAFLFHEGEKGDEMFIILEGRVMISKYIPGGGEEAVAILERGQFFGEMSLLDGEPRSADAKAYGGPVTLVALNQQALAELFAMEPRSALEFLKLLCRLICQRLREIDEKVIGWRIMSGARPDAETVLFEGPVDADDLTPVDA